MKPEENNQPSQKDTVRLIVGISGVFGFFVSLLGILIGIVNWPPERKIILGSILIVVWLISEIIFWRQRRNRSSKEKLPWLIGLFTDVKKELDPDSEKYLKGEQIYQILRWSFISLIITIVFATGINWGEFELSSVINPPTFTPIPSETLTVTPSSTNTLTPSPRPISDSLYYMIVYDSSMNMNERFHGEEKWQVARNLLVEIINGLNPRAQYNMAVIGGSNPTDNTNPCDTPASLSLPSFSSKRVAYDYLGSLRPQGGGSFYKAYTLAKNQLQDLPEDTIRTLIYITGSSDTCNTEDEWTAIKNLMSISDSTFNIFSQIIILDNDGIKSRTLAEQFNSLSNDNVNAQAPQSVSEVQSGGVTVVHIVNNVTNYVNSVVTAIPTNKPTRTITPTSTVILRPYESPVVLPTDTPIILSTFTKTIAPTATRTVTSSATLFPNVLYITSPANGASLNCLKSEDCMIPVSIQWIPDTQATAQGLYLSVWVKPYPGDSNYLFYSQTPVTYLGNGVWRSDPVIVGKKDVDEPGTPFAIYAIVTNQYYDTGVQKSPLPVHSKESVVEVTR